MMRGVVNALLFLAVLASSLWLIKVSHEWRSLFYALEKARAEESRLEIEYQRLDAEREAQATHVRVERIAREKLQMVTATPAVTALVEWSPARAGAAAGGVQP